MSAMIRVEIVYALPQRQELVEVRLPEGATARQAIEADVHVVGVSSLAAGHLTLVPALRKALDELGRSDILIVVGGVIPPDDFDALRAAGAAAIFPPGTVIADAALELLADIDRQVA